MAPTTLANAFSKDSSATAVIVPGSPALHVSYQKLAADVRAFQQQLANVGVTAQAAVRDTSHKTSYRTYANLLSLNIGFHRTTQYLRVHRIIHRRFMAARHCSAPEPGIQAVRIRVLHR
jgi:hypothetical protein